MTPADEYEDTELPTRPDLPDTVARPCVYCGLVYGEHAQTAAPQNALKCRGTRKGWQPADDGDTDGDRQR